MRDDALVAYVGLCAQHRFTRLIAALQGDDDRSWIPWAHCEASKSVCGLSAARHKREEAQHVTAHIRRFKRWDIMIVL
jgi:hypothetical protein